MTNYTFGTFEIIFNSLKFDQKKHRIFRDSEIRSLHIFPHDKLTRHLGWQIISNYGLVLSHILSLCTCISKGNTGLSLAINLKAQLKQTLSSKSSGIPLKRRSSNVNKQNFPIFTIHFKTISLAKTNDISKHKKV